MQDDVETQWTAGAGEAYRARAGELEVALREHVALTGGQRGGAAEWPAYAASKERLAAAVTAFVEAEFDWSGSVPFPAPEFLDDDEDEDAEDEEAGGELVSLFGRWDYSVTDPAAVIAAGRSAYLTAWPAESSADAETAIASVPGAVGELLHLGEIGDLDDVDGLEPVADLVTVLLHDGSDDDEDDPFGLVGG